MGDAFSKVCEVFSFEKLNKHQEDTIKYVVEKEKAIFVNLPTGFRKLLIYQALPIVFSSVQSTCEKYIVVVISPLTSAMKNQVRGCLHDTACFIPVRVHSSSLLWFCIRLHDTSTKSHNGTSHTRDRCEFIPGNCTGARFSFRYENAFRCHVNAVRSFAPA